MVTGRTLRRLFGLVLDDAPHTFWIQRGDAARKRNQLKRAIRCYGRAKRALPHLADTWIQLGCQLLAEGEYEAGEAALQRAIGVRPHVAAPYAHLGRLKLQQGDRQRAAEFFVEALRRDRGASEVADALHDLGMGVEVSRILADPNRYPIAGQVASHFWWHSIELCDGLVTPGICSQSHMSWRYEETFAPLDLEGKSVIDFGAWNGAFSVEAARRGAARVVAVDHYTWRDPYFRGRETFDLVGRVTGLELKARDIDLDDPRLDLAQFERFDIVLFLGVFYHLQNPLSALREVAALAAEVLVVETEVTPGFSRQPTMKFLPGDELKGDATNWWVPSTTCIVELLRLLEFPRVVVSSGLDPFRRVFHAYRS